MNEMALSSFSPFNGTNARITWKGMYERMFVELLSPRPTRWTVPMNIDISGLANLTAFQQRVTARPAVQEALTADYATVEAALPSVTMERIVIVAPKPDSPLQVAAAR